MDSDRGRDSRRKKYSKDKDKEREPAKKMVILMKSKEVKSEELPPTIILKTRDNERAVSPQAASSKPSSKESETSQSYNLAPRNLPTNQGVPVIMPPQMKECIKLLDEDTLSINDSLQEYLTDSNDYLVVGCIGLQGVGKSSIMSHIANPASINNPDQMVFKCQTKNHVDSNLHCSEGVQCYITDLRVILLDTQPVLSLSVLSKYYATDGANLALRTCHRDDPDYPCLENDVEILFLQYIAFILSVCHVVIIAQDYCCDPDLMRFLQTAEMLKPSSSIHPEEESNDYFPHCVFVHNKCSQEAFSHTKVKDVQESYKAMFSHSQLLIQSGMGIANGVFVPSLRPELCGGEPINLFLLPERRRPGKQLAYEIKEYEEIIDLLRSHIYGVPLMPFTQATLSEKKWLHYATKIWEDIKKSPLFVEYGRMLPTASTFKVEQ